MEKERIEELVEAMLELREKDVAMQKASDVFHDALYPDCHNPFLEGNLDGALKILGILEPGVSDWISYFVYEVPGLKRKDPDYDVVVVDGGIRYHMNSKEDLIEFLKTL